MTKAESEQLARALQEEQYFELSQENKKAGARHKQEIVDKEATIARVSTTFTYDEQRSLSFTWKTLQLLLFCQHGVKSQAKLFTIIIVTTA